MVSHQQDEEGGSGGIQCPSVQMRSEYAAKTALICDH